MDLDKALTHSSRFLAFSGLAAIAFGIVVLVWPGLSLEALIALFGAFALVYGALGLSAGLNPPGPPEHRLGTLRPGRPGRRRHRRGHVLSPRNHGAGIALRDRRLGRLHRRLRDHGSGERAPGEIRGLLARHWRPPLNHLWGRGRDLAHFWRAGHPLVDRRLLDRLWCDASRLRIPGARRPGRRQARPRQGRGAVLE